MRYLSKDGFTLIELIFVLLVVGIAMALTAVSISRSYEKTVLRQEAARVQHAMRHARERSLTERVPIGFSLDEESGRYWLERNGAVIGQVRQLKDDLLIRGEPIVFFPKGNSTGGNITIAEKGRQDSIEEHGFEIMVDPVTGIAEAGRF